MLEERSGRSLVSSFLPAVSRPPAISSTTRRTEPTTSSLPNRIALKVRRERQALSLSLSISLSAPLDDPSLYRIIIIRRGGPVDQRIEPLGTIKQSRLIFCRASCSGPLSDRRIRPRRTGQPNSFAHLPLHAVRPIVVRRRLPGRTIINARRSWCSVRWSAAIVGREHGRENMDDFTGFKNAVRRTMVGTIVSWRYLKQGKRRKSERTPFLAGRLMIGGQDGWKDEGGSWMARLSRVISKNKGEARPREGAAGNGRLRGRQEEETAREHQIKSK